MINILKKIRYILVTLCYSLYYVVAMVCNRKEILHDVEFWNERIGTNDNLAMYLFQYPAFRTLFYFHPYSTLIDCERIGEKVIVRHNTTIGNKNSGSNEKPVIGDNVQVGAGTLIIGDVNVGDNVVIGAGSVVVKNVESNRIVVGNPAHYIK